MREKIFGLICITLLTFSTNVEAKMYGAKLCHQQGYKCVTVKKGQTWNSMFPDEHDKSIVMRINRLNIELWSGMVIAVPINLESSNIMEFSPFAQHIEPPNEKLIIVDPDVLAWGAYDSDGSLVRWGPASSGSDYCRDLHEECHTRPGEYRIFTLGSSDCYSTKFPLPYGGAPMPFCMYFHGGMALHGEPNGLPGYNASHGCVRLYVSDAEWLRYNFVEGPTASNNYRGTRVIVEPY